MSTGRLAALCGTIAASSVAPVASGYERSLRPCARTTHRAESARGHRDSGSLTSDAESASNKKVRMVTWMKPNASNVSIATANA